MRHQQWQVGTIALGMGLGLTVNVMAQPNPNETGKAANPANIQMGGPGRGNFTPQMRQQMQTERLTRTLISAGVTTQATQNAVVAYATTQDQARQTLQAQSRALIAAISTPGTLDAQIATLLTNFKAAVAAEKARRKTAQDAIDAKVGYSKHPRLAATLTALNLIGGASLVMNTTNLGNLGGPGGQGGRGGFGGPGGGFGGGPGGQGGPPDGGPGGQGGPPNGGPPDGGPPGGGQGGPPGGPGDNGPPPGQ